MTASKRINQRIHAKKRAFQRYGLTLTVLELKIIARMIEEETDDAEFVHRLTLSRTVWRVKWNGQDLFAVYDKDRHAVATFLTREMVEEKVSV